MPQSPGEEALRRDASVRPMFRPPRGPPVRPSTDSTIAVVGRAQSGIPHRPVRQMLQRAMTRKEKEDRDMQDALKMSYEEALRGLESERDTAVIRVEQLEMQLAQVEEKLQDERITTEVWEEQLRTERDTSRLEARRLANRLKDAEAITRDALSRADAELIAQVDETQRLKDQLERVLDDLSVANADVTREKEAHEETRKHIDDLGTENEQLNSLLEDSRREIDQLRSDSDQDRERILSLEKQLKEEQDASRSLADALATAENSLQERDAQLRVARLQVDKSTTAFSSISKEHDVALAELAQFARQREEKYRQCNEILEEKCAELEELKASNRELRGQFEDCRGKLEARAKELAEVRAESDQVKVKLQARENQQEVLCRELEDRTHELEEKKASLVMAKTELDATSKHTVSVSPKPLQRRLTTIGLDVSPSDRTLFNGIKRASQAFFGDQSPVEPQSPSSLLPTVGEETEDAMRIRVLEEEKTTLIARLRTLVDQKSALSEKTRLLSEAEERLSRLEGELAQGRSESLQKSESIVQLESNLSESVRKLDQQRKVFAHSLSELQKRLSLLETELDEEKSALAFRCQALSETQDQLSVCEKQLSVYEVKMKDADAALISLSQKCAELELRLDPFDAWKPSQEVEIDDVQIMVKEINEQVFDISRKAIAVCEGNDIGGSNSSAVNSRIRVPIETILGLDLFKGLCGPHSAFKTWNLWVQLAIRTLLSNLVNKFHEAWPAPPVWMTGSENEVWSIYKQLVKSEQKELSSVWRLVTVKHYRALQLSTPAMRQQLAGLTLEMIANVLVLSGVSMSVTQVLDDCQLKLGARIDSLWSTVMQLSEDTKGKSYVKDFKLLAASPGARFDERFMKPLWEQPLQMARVLCTAELGLEVLEGMDSEIVSCAGIVCEENAVGL